MLQEKNQKDWLTPGSKLSTPLMLSGVRGALVDLDGCLTSSKGPWHGLTIANTLNRLSLFTKQLGRNLSPEEAQEGYNGLGHGVDYFEVIQKNVIERYAPANAKEIGQNFRDGLSDTIDFLYRQEDLEVYANPAAREFLEGLARANMPVLVVTMTPTLLAETILRKAGLRHLLQGVIGCELQPGWKQWAAIASASMGLKPSEVVVVEDTARWVNDAQHMGISSFVLLRKSMVKDLDITGDTRFWISLSDGDFTAFWGF